MIDVFTGHAKNLISPITALPIFNMHGAATRVAPDATAFGHRRHQWDIDIVSQWTRQFWSDLEPFAGDTIYVNHISGDEPSRIETAFGPNYNRLREVKRTYDPDNVFTVNHNILPA